MTFLLNSVEVDIKTRLLLGAPESRIYCVSSPPTQQSRVTSLLSRYLEAAPVQPSSLQTISALVHHDKWQVIQRKRSKNLWQLQLKSCKYFSSDVPIKISDNYRGEKRKNPIRLCSRSKVHPCCVVGNFSKQDVKPHLTSCEIKCFRIFEMAEQVIKRTNFRETRKALSKLQHDRQWRDWSPS